MLLRDRHFVSFPALAELVEVGDDDVAQERVDREPREQVVEDGVGVGVVEALERGGKLVLGGRSGDLLVVASCCLGGQDGGFGGGVAIGEVVLHRLHACEVVGEYRRSPPAERVGCSSPYRRSQARSNSGLMPERPLSSPIRNRARRLHPPNIQHLYRSLTRREIGDKVTDLYRFSTGGERK